MKMKQIIVVCDSCCWLNRKTMLKRDGAGTEVIPEQNTSELK
jgi:hypothetical protein